jgi:polysaccharide deacetylase 2 family uncharacterized protein YibQ
MLRLKPIRRPKRRGPSRKTSRTADAIFWIVLAFAVGLGAQQAITGFPILMRLFAPSGVIAVKASVPPTADVAGVAPILPRMDVPRIRSSVGEASSTRPAIAIVIDDLGGDVVHTRRAIALPRDVALAFLPYPTDTPTLARAAGRAGHEVIVHVPMQAIGPADPGPMALRTDLAPAENLRRLDWALSRVPGFIGINNHEGSLFSADRDALSPVVEELEKRHVFFFDSRTAANSQIVSVARAGGVESAGRDVFLDDIQAIDAVDAQLHALEMRARTQGIAIAIGHPHEITLDAVAYWTAHESGFELVLLSTALRLKTEHETGRSLALLRH